MKNASKPIEKIMARIVFLSIFGSAKQLHRYVLTLVTDPARQKREDIGTPNDCRQVFPLYQTLGIEKLVEDDCKTAKIGCQECKRLLFQELYAKTDLCFVSKKRDHMEVV